jgi:hypothetical protein
MQPNGLSISGGHLLTKQNAEGITLVKLSHREREIVRMGIPGSSVEEIAAC